MININNYNTLYEDVIIDNLTKYYKELNYDHDSNNSVYTFLTKFTFHSFIVMANTKRIKKICDRIINIYNEYVRNNNQSFGAIYN